MNPPFFKIPSFLEIQDVPTFYRPIRKTNVLNWMTFNRFVYKFYPQSILILEEFLLKWWNVNLIHCVSFFWSILWKMDVRERNIHLLLEAVTYMATMETATCIITIEIVMCIMHCRKYHLHDCNRDSHLHNFNKNCHPHICCRNFHLHKCCRNF